MSGAAAISSRLVATTLLRPPPLPPLPLPLWLVGSSFSSSRMIRKRICNVIGSSVRGAMNQNHCCQSHRDDVDVCPPPSPSEVVDEVEVVEEGGEGIA